MVRCLRCRSRLPACHFRAFALLSKGRDTTRHDKSLFTAREQYAAAMRMPIMALSPLGETTPLSSTEHTMSKSQDSKKAVKKEPAKSPKEKKEAKKIKKEASKRQ